MSESSGSSLTTWTRIEPRSRVDDPDQGLRAELLDPLWMMGRQWQLGAFEGEDTGSPISVRARATETSLTHYSPTAGKEVPLPRPYNPLLAPLEAVVERERINARASEASYDAVDNLSRSIEAGQHLLRILKMSGTLTTQAAIAFQRPAGYELPTPDQERLRSVGRVTARLWKLLFYRVPDGVRLYRGIAQAQGSGTLDELLASFGIDTADAQLVHEISQAIEKWLDWYRTSLYVPEDDFDEAPSSENPEDSSGQTPSSEELQELQSRLKSPAWRSSRLCHRFSVSAVRTGDGQTPDTEVTLAANNYGGGHLDWYSFDLASQALGGTTPNEAASITTTVYPQAVRYRGMPAVRFWDFEDAEVHFGGTGTTPEDLTGMLLTEFALSFGNDWSLLPLRQTVGTLCTIDSLVVTDVFGVRTLIRPSKVSTPSGLYWRLFEISPATNPEPATMLPAALFLPPVLPRTADQEPIERVLFMRDEGANLAWAVEELVPASGGGSLDRADAYRHGSALTLPPQPSDTWTYALNTTVPDYWFPLMPRRVPGDEEYFFELGQAPASDSFGQPVEQEAMGNILKGLQQRRLLDDAVPREGLQISRVYQSAVWLNGQHFTWIGRRRKVGRIVGESGLEFDFCK